MIVGRPGSVISRASFRHEMLVAWTRVEVVTVAESHQNLVVFPK